MAEDDKRLEVLEDEIKVLKGEIRRTLVDLRAHLMREGSPLNEGAFSRRGASPRPEPREELTATRQEVAETVTADPQALLQSEQAEMASPGVIAGNFVLGVQSPAQADPGAGAAPASAPPGVAGAPASRPQYPPPASGESIDGQPSPQQEVEVVEEYIVEGGGPERVGVHIHQAAPAMGPPERAPRDRHRRSDAPDLEMSRPGRYHDDEDWDDEAARSGRSRRKESQPHSRAGPQHRRNSGGQGHYREDDEAGRNSRERGAARQNGRGSRIYDEYLDLMAETEELYSAEDDPARNPLDVNLLASLVRWASVARQRVGEQRLADILELYFQSGHCYPGLQDLLKHIATMVDDVPAGASESAEECIDLLAHLHGILTGAQPITRVPNLKLTDSARRLLARSAPATGVGR